MQYKRLTPLFVLLLLFVPVMLMAQPKPVDKTKKVTLSGKIQDIKTGEELIGATVFIKELKTGTTSNVYGFYSLTLPPGEYTFQYSFIGYGSREKKINLTTSMVLNIELSLKEEILKEVIVTSEKANQNVTAHEMSTVKMDIRTINKIPSLMGESDIIKAIQMLPGVQAVSEGSSGFSVRGGAPDQNLIMLDEATVYNASHLMGFFSVFNNDAIKDVKLYKGDIPATFGGRLSSVLDVRMKEGNNKHYFITGGIGLIASRLTIESPIIKDRTSFIVSGRRTYADLFIPLSSNKDLKGNKLYFYDLNAKINHQINDKNHIFLSGYFGRDIFKNSFAGMEIGNETATFRWNHLFSQKVFSNFTVLYSNYRYQLGSPEGNANSFVWKSNLRDVGVKGDLNFYLDTRNTLRFGISSTYHTFDPGRAYGTGDQSFFTEYILPKSHALESAIYLGNEQIIGARLTAKYGLRISMFQSVGSGTSYTYDSSYKAVDSTSYASGDFYKTYVGLEPRLGLIYTLDEVSSIKASYSRTLQYIQLAQNSTAGTPLDLWFPASPNVEPQVCNQFALGYFRNFLNNQLETSVEAYYKKLDRVIDFKDHAVLLLNKYLEGELRVGSGQAYGLEFMVKKAEGRLNGWISYTLSHTDRKIKEINGGRTYLAPFDRPHNLNIVLNYDLSKRFSVSANWVYARGAAVTFPTGRALIGGKYIPIYSDRNAYRMPDYHRLDVSVTLKGKNLPEKRFGWDLNVSVYNAYARHNAWAINFVQDKDNPDITYAEKTYLFGLIPSITFNFHF